MKPVASKTRFIRSTVPGNKPKTYKDLNAAIAHMPGNDHWQEIAAKLEDRGQNILRFITYASLGKQSKEKLSREAFSVKAYDEGYEALGKNHILGLISKDIKGRIVVTNAASKSLRLENRDLVLLENSKGQPLITANLTEACQTIKIATTNDSASSSYSTGHSNNTGLIAEPKSNAAFDELMSKLHQSEATD